MSHKPDSEKCLECDRRYLTDDILMFCDLCIIIRNVRKFNEGMIAGLKMANEKLKILDIIAMESNQESAVTLIDYGQWLEQTIEELELEKLSKELGLEKEIER